jgi:hypothetical protein
MKERMQSGKRNEKEKRCRGGEEVGAFYIEASEKRGSTSQSEKVKFNEHRAKGQCLGVCYSMAH